MTPEFIRRNGREELTEQLADELKWQHETRKDHRCSRVCRARNLLKLYEIRKSRAEAEEADGAT